MPFACGIPRKKEKESKKDDKKKGGGAKRRERYIARAHFATDFQWARALGHDQSRVKPDGNFWTDIPCIAQRLPSNFGSSIATGAIITYKWKFGRAAAGLICHVLHRA